MTQVIRVSISFTSRYTPHLQSSFEQFAPSFSLRVPHSVAKIEIGVHLIGINFDHFNYQSLAKTVQRVCERPLEIVTMIQFYYNMYTATFLTSVTVSAGLSMFGLK